MDLWLVMLRLLMDRLVPSWDGSVPLAIRRDGRLQNRPRRKHRLGQVEAPHEVLREPQSDLEPVPRPFAAVWRSLVQVFLRAAASAARLVALSGRPGSS
jgi:hypothetical protein